MNNTIQNHNMTTLMATTSDIEHNQFSKKFIVKLIPEEIVFIFEADRIDAISFHKEYNQNDLILTKVNQKEVKMDTCFEKQNPTLICIECCLAD